MEIIKEYKMERYGNEYLITDYVCLIELDYHLYVIIHTKSMGNSTDTKHATVKYYDDALRCMMMIVNKLELG